MRRVARFLVNVASSAPAHGRRIAIILKTGHFLSSAR